MIDFQALVAAMLIAYTVVMAIEYILGYKEEFSYIPFWMMPFGAFTLALSIYYFLNGMRFF